MEIDTTSQEKLRLKDVCEDKQEKVKLDNCNTGESHITTVFFTEAYWMLQCSEMIWLLILQ